MKKTIQQMENIHHGGNRHFIITVGKKVYFESYGKLIAVVNDGRITLNRHYWDYSQTTAAYRNRFLGMTTKEIERNIATGGIKLRTMDSSIINKLHQ